MSYKKRTIRRFFLILVLGTIVGMGLLYFVDRGLDGALTGWFEDRLMAVYGYTETAAGEMIYIWRPNWQLVKLYAIGATFLAVLLFSGLTVLLARLLMRADVRDRMEALGDMIHTYMFSEKEASDVFPQEYNAIAIQASEVKEKMRRHEQLLREEAARKNDLITYLAHDLKTPLTSVIGYLSLLSEAPDMPVEQRARYTQIGLEKSLRLESLINEFFDITRFNLQQVHLSKATVDLTYLLVQMTDEFYPLAEHHGNTIHLDVPDDLTLVGDANKLARVFNNILKNAVAYSDAGTDIYIHAFAHEGQVTLTFTNRGPTIPPEKLEMLFEKFYRLDESRSTQTGGAGLGLAIAREIVTLHGGEITAGSRHGETTFTVTLPQH